MKTVTVLCVIGSMFGVALGTAISTAINSDRKAERQVCTEIAEDVAAGTITRTAYMGTRCPARLLIEGNAHVPHD